MPHRLRLKAWNLRLGEKTRHCACPTRAVREHGLFAVNLTAIPRCAPYVPQSLRRGSNRELSHFLEPWANSNDSYLGTNTLLVFLLNAGLGKLVYPLRVTFHVYWQRCNAYIFVFVISVFSPLFAFLFLSLLSVLFLQILFLDFRFYFKRISVFPLAAVPNVFSQHPI